MESGFLAKAGVVALIAVNAGLAWAVFDTSRRVKTLETVVARAASAGVPLSRSSSVSATQVAAAMPLEAELQRQIALMRPNQAEARVLQTELARHYPRILEDPAALAAYCKALAPTFDADRLRRVGCVK